jgi:hypothetical protein
VRRHEGCSGKQAGLVEQIEACDAISSVGGFMCIKFGEWDDDTAARLVEQKGVRIFSIAHFFIAIAHTLCLTSAHTSSSLRAETEATD